MSTETKPCSKCKEPKPLTDFHRRGAGFQSICKVCRCSDARDGYREHGKTKTGVKTYTVNTLNFPTLETRIEKLQPSLTMIANRFSTDRHDADDIYSEIVSKILVTCSPEHNDGYLLQCAKWTAQQHISKHETYVQYCAGFDTTEEDDFYPGLQVAERTTENAIIDREEMDHLYAVIATLPVENQAIVKMLSVGKSSRQIASHLRTSEYSIHQRINAIRAQMTLGLVTSAAI